VEDDKGVEEMPECIVDRFQAMFLNSEYIGMLFFFNPRKDTCQKFGRGFYEEQKMRIRVVRRLRLEST